MEKMSLGNTVEEKKATYEALTAHSKKWGKVVAIVGFICMLALGLMLMSASESILLGVVILLAFAVIGPIFYYWYGQVLYYGYLVIRSFSKQTGIGAGDVAAAAGTSFLVSYVLGGRKATKKLGVAWLIILLIAVTIGVYAGLYYWLKFRKEAKKLGFFIPTFGKRTQVA